jgi:putative ABC transport system substrate-binding protein
MVRRREVIAGLGGAAVWPLAALAQRRSVPAVGILSIGSARMQTLAAFSRGLSETGYVEGRNVAIEYRGILNEFDRLPELAADLVRRQVAVIFATGAPAVLAVKAQTTTIPIVFFVGEDPVKEGLVASLNRPGSNVTGATNFQNQLFPKQLAMLHDAVPKATVFGFLVNPNNPNAEPDIKDVQAAAKELGWELRVHTAQNEDELEAAFAAMVQERVGALLVGVGVVGGVAPLAARHAIPAMYPWPEAPAAGGLMSYGASVAEAFHLCGIYVGRILKGEKPADLPVQRSTRFEFVINLKTAKALGLTIPETLLATADEVIQ